LRRVSILTCWQELPVAYSKGAPIGPPGPFGSIQVKVPPYFASVDVDVGFVTVDGATVAGVVDTGLDVVGAIVVGDVGDDVRVCAGVVTGGVVVLGLLQPTTNSAPRRSTDKAITMNDLFI
jgi:hypothetical protein